ncbi:VanW family protein [Desulfosporosinus sp. Sb-LF]|uniref:VanW family protein n=1 Tax=Desulfosporosinus sp. Sb-LF TaxID=2560027 RepID=UPI00107F4EC6|nr:VanW family protein [Desulfosporosinus sp. Sb-LF]TGE31890.1 vanomycin resistance protein VanB [Desulfosporosinus sp. Sb-LF]
MEEDASPAELSRSQGFLKRHKILLIILSTGIILFGVLTLTLVLYTQDRGQIAKGVILEIPLGQLPIEEAHSKLKQLRNETYKRPVQFISGDKKFNISMEELGFTYSYDEPLRQASLIGREGTLFNKAISKYKASFGITFKPDYHWNDQVLTEALTKHLSTLNIPAEDAHFSINSDNSLQIILEKPGKQVDINSLITSIKKQALDEAQIISIPFSTVTPSLTKTVLENVKLNKHLSDYTTCFNPNQKERTLNIQLASKALDGLVLKPGGVFSFNNSVGPRTAEAGYQEAIIIEGNKFVPGLGGGVCQVSSTLYNAVLLASPSLNVIERSRHSLPIAYVPPGQDATVAYPTLDFKFRNDSNGYLLIRSSINNNTLLFSLVIFS